MFTLNIKKLHQELEARDAKKVLILLPEGVLETFRDLHDYFRKTPIEVILSGDEHWGGCDVPVEAYEDLKVDTIVSVGHTEYFPKYRDNILFFPMDFSHQLMPSSMEIVLAPLYENYKSIAISWSTEFAAYAQPILQFLQTKMNVIIPGSSYLVTEGQVLGCHYNRLVSLESTVDAFLIVSDAFHSSGSLYDTRKPVYWMDPYNASLRDITPLREPLIYKRLQVIQRAEESKHFGIVVEKRYGQQRVATAKRLQKFLEESNPDRRASIYYMSDVSPAKLQRFLGTVDVFVNTACPRIESFEESGVFVLNIEEALSIAGKKKLESIYPILSKDENVILGVRPQEGNVECDSDVSSSAINGSYDEIAKPSPCGAGLACSETGCN